MSGEEEGEAGRRAPGGPGECDGVPGPRAVDPQWSRAAREGAERGDADDDEVEDDGSGDVDYERRHRLEAPAQA